MNGLIIFYIMEYSIKQVSWLSQQFTCWSQWTEIYRINHVHLLLKLEYIWLKLKLTHSLILEKCHHFLPDWLKIGLCKHLNVYTLLEIVKFTSLSQKTYELYKWKFPSMLSNKKIWEDKWCYCLIGNCKKNG
jgi:hypothetical protein